MLNNRKSMLALLLGMSLAVTFPVGVDASDKGADTAQETMQDSENTTDSVQDTENTESTESEPPQPETRATEAESETTADTKAEETQESEEIQTETQQSEPDETDPEDTKEKDQDLDEKAAQREKEKEKAKDKKDSSKSEKDAMSEQKFDERFEKLVIDPEELEKSFRFETVAKRILRSIQRKTAMQTLPEPLQRTDSVTYSGKEKTGLMLSPGMFVVM